MSCQVGRGGVDGASSSDARGSGFEPRPPHHKKYHFFTYETKRLFGARCVEPILYWGWRWARTKKKLKLRCVSPVGSMIGACSGWGVRGPVPGAAECRITPWCPRCCSWGSIPRGHEGWPQLPLLVVQFAAAWVVTSSTCRRFDLAITHTHYYCFFLETGNPFLESDWVTWLRRALVAQHLLMKLTKGGG